MKRTRIVAMGMALCMGIGLLSWGISSHAEGPAVYKIDKAKCALMMRFGKEALERSRFEEAKYYFQSAVQADPFNPKPWNWYDLATFYAVADQMRKEGKYLVRPSAPSAPSSTGTGAAIQGEESAPAPGTEAVQPPAEPESGTGFVIEEDEGC